MYETLMNTLRQFLGSGMLKTCLVTAISFSVAVLSAYMSPAFRAFLVRMKDRGGWRNVTVTLTAGMFKFLLIFVLLRLFTTMLVFQADVFTLQHGRITGRNRSAVLMKWGYPHEQKELAVHHTRKRTWVTRQLKTEDEPKKKGRVFSESYWKDESYPVRAVEGKIPSVLSVKEGLRDVAVNQKSIASADIEIGLRNNPRTLGNANYAGYNDAWHLTYVVANRSQWSTTAHMSFPLPCKSGLFDEMVLKVDGRDALDVAKTSNGAIVWIVDMESGAEVEVEISYNSRGLEHLRYIPKRMSQTGHYRVGMTIHGVAADKLDFPIGSMPAAESLSDIDTDPYTLTWKLDNALTSYDIGIKLPVAEQPNYYFAQLLHDAPIGLVLLVVMLTVPRILLRRSVRVDMVAVCGIAYCLHYTFMGRLADIMPGFAGPFMISAGVLVAVIIWLKSRDAGILATRIQDSVAFIIFAVVYPLMIVDSDMTDLWMQYLYVFMLLYSCVLIACRQSRTVHRVRELEDEAERRD